ncbi:MAG: phosphatidate cytidylyltransferase [Muribaculaceae bacterium]|nr:phosphatidate cytidylyltransferase [Muribaculaceae bacterium]MDE6028444.1 phosphatidate cytidylyltransferase [Muribaculaceae bacterium]
MELKKLLTRAFSGLIYVIIIVGSILWGYPGVALLGVLFAILATYELEKICHDVEENNKLMLWLDIAGVVALSLSFNPWITIVPIIVWICIMIVRFVSQLYVKNANPLRSLSHSFLAQIYIGVPLASMSACAFLVDPKVILLVFIMLWINDTGAFIVGSLIGKHKLFERISPKKSWEGFFGGLIFNIIAAVLFCYCSDSFMGLHSNIAQWLAVAVIVTVFGTWGDLIESMIKRHLNIKDSGNLIPGHGGILDRIDSFLLAMPAILVFFAIGYLFF